MKKHIATLVFVLLLFGAMSVYAISEEDVDDLCRHASYLAMKAYELGYEGYSCEAISKKKIREYFVEVKNYGIDISPLDIDKIRENLVTVCESGWRNRQNMNLIDPLYIRFQFRKRCKQHPGLLILKTEDSK